VYSWLRSSGAIASLEPQSLAGLIHPELSEDGRFLVFESWSTNLVPDDTNNVGDIFVLDRVTNTSERVSTGYDGSESNSQSSQPAISADGRIVAFRSYATNLVPDDTTGGWNTFSDLFVFDRATGETTRVSVSDAGDEAQADSGDAAVSPDGRFVAFNSCASNLVPDDHNSECDVFVSNLDAGTVERVSIAYDGAEANGDSFAPAISSGGRFVVFESRASNLVADDTNGYNDVFLVDRETDTIERVSVSAEGVEANFYAVAPDITPDGRFVVFASLAQTLVPDKTTGAFDIFLVDRQLGTVERISTSAAGGQANGDSYDPVVSDDGQVVAFRSEASNLTPGDANGVDDLYVVDRSAP
jgi:Tol biopolymer transport system component